LFLVFENDLLLVWQVLEFELGGDWLSARPRDIHIDGLLVPALRYDAHRLDLVAVSIFDVANRVEHGLLRRRNARGEVGLPHVAVTRDVLGEQAGLPRAMHLIVVPSNDRDDREDNHSAQDFD